MPRYKLWGPDGGVLITIKMRVLAASGFLCGPHIIPGGWTSHEANDYLNQWEQKPEGKRGVGQVQRRALLGPVSPQLRAWV